MTSPRLIVHVALACTLVLLCSANNLTPGQKSANREVEIAARFSPIFYQALGDNPRSDYITNFDFDGDWQGDNNWNNAANRELPLKAYIYYSVAETSTHYFIHYAVFHPRDYKGGERRGTLLSELIRKGTEQGAKYDPTGLADEAALAHENDMEGSLVVVKKNGSDLAAAKVVFVETLHHNNFARYETGESQAGFSIVTLEAERPLLYIEPKGHGIESLSSEEKQTSNKSFLRYVYGARADNPALKDSVCRDLQTTLCTKSVSYDLVSLAVLWSKAKGKPNATYGVAFDYGEVKLTTIVNGSDPTKKTFKIGTVGCAFLGKVGGVNMARPPWGWFDRDEREQPLGQWFFDPATVVKRDFKLDSTFSTTYVRTPFWAMK